SADISIQLDRGWVTGKDPEQLLTAAAWKRFPAQMEQQLRRTGSTAEANGMDSAATKNLSAPAPEAIHGSLSLPCPHEQCFGSDLFAIKQSCVGGLGKPETKSVRLQRNHDATPGGAADQPAEKLCRWIILLMGQEAFLPAPRRREQDFEAHIIEITTEAKGDGIAHLLDHFFRDAFGGRYTEGSIEIHCAPGKEFHWFSLPA
ncbi:MAG: hypothetical protein FJY85_26165, partial [Deltaproteobacteria bacterium]|nr:hypothetical protein [Deltaproteobacteria bacterium]